MKEFVEWMLYAAAWQLLLTPWTGYPKAERNAAIDVIEEYVES